MGLMTVRAIFQHGRMLVQERTASFGMARVTVLVEARLFELRRIRRPVGIVAARASQLSFPHRHMGRPHQLRLSLQMALAADFRLRLGIGERSVVVDLGQLITVGGLLHQGVTVNATHAATRMRAGFPIGLHAALVAA